MSARYARQLTEVALGLACCMSLAAGTEGASSTREGVVAVVGDQPITYGDVLDLQRNDPRPIAAVREDLVRFRLLVLEGERLLGDDERLKAEVSKQAELLLKDQARSAGGEVRLRELLRAEGISNDKFREHQRDSVLADMVLARYVRSRPGAGPAPERVREYYETHAGEFRRPREVQYREIFLPFGEGTAEGRRAARAQAHAVHAGLAAGASFAQLAMEQSGGPHAREGGLWPAGDWGHKSEDLRRAILALEEKRFTKPLEADDGIYLFYGEKVTPEGIQPFLEVQPAIQRRLEEDARRARREELFAELEERFYVQRNAL